jgi:hypothetical protein
MTDNEGKTTEEGGKLEPPKESSQPEANDRDVFTAPTVIGTATSDILALVKAANEGAPRPITVPPVRDPLPTLPAGAISAADVASSAEQLAEERGWDADEEMPPSQRMTLPPVIVAPEEEGATHNDTTAVLFSPSAGATAEEAPPRPADLPPPMTGPTGTAPVAWFPQGQPLPDVATNGKSAKKDAPPNGVAKIPQSAVETVAIRAVAAQERPHLFVAMVAAATILFVVTLVAGLLAALR